MLTCECGDFDLDDSNWGYYIPDDFTNLDYKRRKRCCSCDQFISIGAQCVEFGRVRAARSDIEERIHGDEVKLSSWFMCESCGEIFLNLEAIGYCINLSDDMREELREYWTLTGFKPQKEEL